MLFGVSLAVAPGEMVTLMGRNGMGKTTTVRSIMGLTPARAGRIRFEGQEIRGLAAYRVAQRGIGLVPEGRQIFPNLTVRENLVATAVARDGRLDAGAGFELFPRLAERAGSMGNQLSGGEQQMLAIGRALMTNPRLLILDEATEGLAPLIRAEIWRCLARLKQSGPVDSGDRQECRRADAGRRPAFPDRARPHRLDGRFRRARRRAGRAAPVSGRVTLDCRPGRARLREGRDPYAADLSIGHGVWVPAFAGTTTLLRRLGHRAAAHEAEVRAAEPAVQPVEQQVDHRRGVEREHLRHQQARR